MAETADARDASRRALELLAEHCTPEQRATLDKGNFIEMEVCCHRWDGSRRFRLRTDRRDFNVEQLGARGNVAFVWCAKPRAVPNADMVLAQKLALEHDPELFFAVANRG